MHMQDIHLKQTDTICFMLISFNNKHNLSNYTFLFSHTLYTPLEQSFYQYSATYSQLEVGSASLHCSDHEERKTSNWIYSLALIPSYITPKNAARYKEI